MLAKQREYPPKGTSLEGWAHPCGLAPSLMAERTLDYDVEAFPFVKAAEAIFKSSSLGNLHHESVSAPLQTPPSLRRAQVQARVGLPISKVERKGARDHAKRYEKTTEWREFLDIYQTFITDWVLPQIYDGVPILYQRKPILRVVLPGSVAPTALHSDADYWHDPNEINYWVPLTTVQGTNSLWSESRPGAGDYHPFEAHAGQAVRFYGNRCRHFTKPNTEDSTRVSFDFRIIPQQLFRPPKPIALTLSRHALDPGASKRGYYALAHPKGFEPDEAALAKQRREWREAQSKQSAQSELRVSLGDGLGDGRASLAKAQLQGTNKQE